jgi:hypothetical protein
MDRNTSRLLLVLFKRYYRGASMKPCRRVPLLCSFCNIGVKGHLWKMSKIAIFFICPLNFRFLLDFSSTIWYSLHILQYYIWCGFRTISLAKSVTWYTEYLMYFFHCEETRPLVSIITSKSVSYAVSPSTNIIPRV